jgi:hypothetical protein
MLSFVGEIAIQLFSLANRGVVANARLFSSTGRALGANWEKIFEVEGRSASGLTPCPSNRTALHYAESVPERVLDMGCGNSAFGIALAKSRPDARILAVDNSEGALKRGFSQAKRFGVDDQIQFACTDASRFDYSQEGPFSMINFDMVLQYMPPAQREAAIEQAIASLEDGGIFGVRVLLAQNERRTRALSSYHAGIKNTWHADPTEPNTFIKGSDYRHFFGHNELQPFFRGMRPLAELETEFMPMAYDVKRYMQSQMLVYQKNGGGPLTSYPVPRLPLLKYYDQIPSHGNRILLLGHSEEVVAAIQARPDRHYDIEVASFVDEIQPNRYGLIALTIDETHPDWGRYEDQLRSGKFQKLINEGLVTGGFGSINFSRRGASHSADLSKTWMLKTFGAHPYGNENQFMFHALGSHFKPNEAGIDEPHRVLRMVFKSTKPDPGKAVCFYLPKIDMAPLVSKDDSVSSTGLGTSDYVPVTVEHPEVPGLLVTERGFSKAELEDMVSLSFDVRYSLLRSIESGAVQSKAVKPITGKEGYSSVPVDPSVTKQPGIAADVFFNYGDRDHLLVYFTDAMRFPRMFDSLVEKVATLRDIDPIALHHRLTVNYYLQHIIAGGKVERPGFEYHTDLWANGDSTHIIASEAGEMQLIKAPERVNGIPDPATLQKWIQEQEPVSLLVNPGDLVSLTGESRFDWLHRVVPAMEPEIQDPLTPRSRISWVLGERK